MCGVAGFISNNITESSVSVARNMLSAIRHRGPDESGIYWDNNAILGSVRLSIIDLASGQQPLSNEDGKLWIVFNGEIFNYIELREELLALGYRFKTQSDTEVLLHIYQQFGEAGLSKLNGQFVFAIWDNVKEELFIARDRLGIRPLYYFNSNQQFIFGSEIKAIMQHPEVSLSVDHFSLGQLFTYWTMLPGRSLFNEIKELQPGHYLKYRKGNLEIKQYWELCFATPDSYCSHSFNDAVDHFEGLITDAVKLRLRSDVPVAAYLSGGLDSSIISALVKKITPQHLQTFSIQFADAEYDETSYQQEVSKYLDTKHVSFNCTSEEIADIFPKVIWSCESSMFRTAPAPMYLLSKKVRENGIKVVLTGEGADEIFAGYDLFKELQIRSFWAKEPNSRMRPLLLKKLYPYIPQINQMSPQTLKFVFGYKLSEVDNPFYAFLLRWKNGSFIRNFLSAEVKNSFSEKEMTNNLEAFLPDNFSSLEPLSKAQFIETKLLMSNYLLSSQGDRVGMANSIEGRYPFLDYRLVEYAAKLPPQYKLKGLNEKYLLKKMMVGKLPDRIVKRNKQAYRSPISSVFYGKKRPDYVDTYLSESKLNQFGLFDVSSVHQLLNKFSTMTNVSENDTMALTFILSTQMFYAMYKEKEWKPVQYKDLLNPNVIHYNK